jgi:hypothetical protein
VESALLLLGTLVILLTGANYTLRPYQSLSGALLLLDLLSVCALVLILLHFNLHTLTDAHPPTPVRANSSGLYESVQVMLSEVFSAGACELGPLRALSRRGGGLVPTSSAQLSQVLSAVLSGAWLRDALQQLKPLHTQQAEVNRQPLPTATQPTPPPVGRKEAYLNDYYDYEKQSQHTHLNHQQYESSWHSSTPATGTADGERISSDEAELVYSLAAMVLSLVVMLFTQRVLSSALVPDGDFALLGKTLQVSLPLFAVYELLLRSRYLDHVLPFARHLMLDSHHMIVYSVLVVLQLILPYLWPLNYLVFLLVPLPVFSFLVSVCLLLLLLLLLCVCVCVCVWVCLWIGSLSTRMRGPVCVLLCTLVHSST